MPCDTIQTSSLTLEHPNLDLLTKALEALGYSVTRNAAQGLSFTKGYADGGTWKNGQLKVKTRYQDADTVASTIKLSYSKQIVGFAAKQFGWTLSEFEAGTRAGVALQAKAKK